jgi:hypothetical protein
MHGKANHVVYEAGPILFGKTVGVQHVSHLPGALSRARQPAPVGNFVVVQLAVQPRRLGQLPTGINRSREIPIDKCG